MSRSGIVKNLVFLCGFSVVAFWVLVSIRSDETKVQAFEACPAYMTDEECLTFYEDQASQIQEDRAALEDSIGAEDVEQMTLSQQITYLASLVAETELKISEKQVAIETNNVEIRIIGHDILETQNSIDTLTQEINTLENIIQKRTTSSYKMTFMSPLEIVLDSNNFETMIRRIKYLAEAKKKDRSLLTEMDIARDELATEEATLAEKRLEVQEKRNIVESEKATLAEEESNLESQKAQQQVLLAESQRREQELLAQLDQTRQSEGALDAQISELIQRLIDEGKLASEGYVSKGTLIGEMGSTGCSTGAHLHFSINNNKNASCSSGGWTINGVFCGTVSPWGGYLTLGPDWWQQSGGWTYYFVRSGSFQVPLSGNVVLTQDLHQGTAIDLVSLDGEGAPVYAAYGGQLTRGVESICGGKFALIEHPDGMTTIYLHLR